MSERRRCGLRLAGRKEGEPGPAKRLKAKPSGAHKDDLRTRLGNLKTGTGPGGSEGS